MQAGQVDTDHVIEDLNHGLRGHDREAAVAAALSAVEQGLSIEDLYSQVLEPFLASVGHTWQEGSTAVWEEHLIVGAVRTVIEALYPTVLRRKAQVQPVPVTVAFFCPPEETHDLGLRMLADRFDLRGFDTVYVGAVTPVGEMVECVRATGAAAICLSTSSHFQRALLPNVVGGLREALPEVRVVLGGPAFALSDEGWEAYRPSSLEQLFVELAAMAGNGGSAHA
jgi:MerR family transcriptional regulator, light-induced transcriptional regulator